MRLWKNPKERYAAFQRTFESPEGRKVLVDLYHTFMAASPLGPNEMATFVRIGQQEVIRYVLTAMSKDLLEMQEEVSGYEWEPES